ncbi:MAG TPA: hypothetical protein VIG32_05925 [Candidatus Baltobacteraceae bacterium]|jgi:hypothetical protein
MEPTEVRDHLEMVDRILAQANRAIQTRGTLFILWGVVAAILNLTAQMAVNAGAWQLWQTVLDGGLYLAAIVISIAYVRRYQKSGRLNVTELQFIRILWISLAAAFVAEVGAPNIFTHWAMSAIWSICIAIPLLFIGAQGQRYALAGGVVLLASVIVANYTPHTTGIVLAIGDIVGYAGAGVAFELQRRDG